MKSSQAVALEQGLSLETRDLRKIGSGYRRQECLEAYDFLSLQRLKDMQSGNSHKGREPREECWSHSAPDDTRHRRLSIQTW